MVPKLRDLLGPATKQRGQAQSRRPTSIRAQPEGCPAATADTPVGDRLSVWNNQTVNQHNDTGEWLKEIGAGVADAAELAARTAKAPGTRAGQPEFSTIPNHFGLNFSIRSQKPERKTRPSVSFQYRASRGTLSGE